MNASVVHHPPSARAIAVEQLRAVGLAIRRETLVLAAALTAMVVTVGVVAVLPGIRAQLDGELPIRLNPEDLGYLAIVVAVIFPLAVWKGESPWGETQLWSLPVKRPRHALIKVAAGWVWLMGVLGLGLLALCATTLLSGGDLGIETTRLLALDPAAAMASGGTAGTTPVEWTSAWFQWLVPFTAATAIYLLATAVWLGTPHPWRWLAAGYFGLLVVGGVLELSNIAALESAAMRGIGSFDQLVSGGMESLRRFSRSESGEGGWFWLAFPTAGRWFANASIWIGAGLLAVLAAAVRHREA